MRYWPSNGCAHTSLDKGSVAPRCADCGAYPEPEPEPVSPGGAGCACKICDPEPGEEEPSMHP